MQLTHDEITRLSPEERLTLIAQLWDSLDDDQVPLTTAQQAELERRLATLDQDRAQSVSWETLKAELAQRCP
jgi:putative addiction module component (TIGR02574 family)